MSTTHGWEGDVGDEKQVAGPPPLPPSFAPRKKRQFGLRHMMVLSAVSAVIMAVIGRALQTGNERDIVLAIVVIAAGIFLSGVYVINWLGRWTAAGWVLIVVGLLGGSIVLTGGISLIVVPVVVGGLIFILQRRRAIEQDAMLWVLALAADRQRPLGPAVLALGRQTNGVYRERAYRLAECLDQGMPLPDSLEFVRKSVSPPAKVIVRVGHESGRLAQALRDAAVARSSRQSGIGSIGMKIGYFCLILTVLQVITGFILYFIMPKFEAIFKDFGVSLPEVTIVVISATHLVSSAFIFPIFIVSEMLFVLYLLFAIFGYNSLKVPLFDRFFLRRHTVLILRCLTLIVEGGVPIDTGLRTLAQWYPTGWIRQRLAGAHLTHARGMGWVDSLRNFGLINRADAALLDASIRLDNLPWALRELTESSERKLHQRVQALSQIMLTLALIGIGALVGFFAVAYFYPLVVLIERLT